MPVEARDQENLVSYIRYVMRHHGGEIVLVVADGEMIPAMIDELHGSKRLPPFDPNDFDELYIVTSPWYGKVKTLRLHYGASSGFAVERAVGRKRRVSALQLAAARRDLRIAPLEQRALEFLGRQPAFIVHAGRAPLALRLEQDRARGHRDVQRCRRARASESRRARRPRQALAR